MTISHGWQQSAQLLVGPPHIQDVQTKSSGQDGGMVCHLMVDK